MKSHMLNILRTHDVDVDETLLSDLMGAFNSELKAAKEDSFNDGVLYSAGILVEFIDQPLDAKALIEQAGIGDYDCSMLDDTEKAALRKISGLNLRGL